VTDGASATLDVTGQGQISGGSLVASGGAQINPPGVMHQTTAGLIRAEGAGSRIVLNDPSSIGIPPPDALNLTEGISREASIYRGQLDNPDPRADLTEAVSREGSVCRGRLDSANPLDDVGEAISREASVRRAEPEPSPCRLANQAILFASPRARRRVRQTKNQPGARAMHEQCRFKRGCGAALTLILSLSVPPVLAELAIPGADGSDQWAVVFKYSSVDIPAGVNVTFKNHPRRLGRIPSASRLSAAVWSSSPV
jgi:hypothetical protein